MRRLILIAQVGCALLMTGCASRRPSLPAAPQVAMPREATRPCEIYRLPKAPTQADLEIGYAKRGAQIVACDAARSLAVATHEAEHELEGRMRSKERR